MISVVFPTAEPETLTFVVICAKYGNQWVFVRHRERATFEIPGGHIEAGESALQAAKRELYEETGATAFELREVCDYGVERDGVMTHGKLFFAEITELGELPPDYEMAERILSDTLPKNMTYPEIYPKMFERLMESGIA